MSEPQQPPYPAQGQPNQHPPANPAPAWPTAQPLGQPQPAAPYPAYPQPQASPGYAQPQAAPGYAQPQAPGAFAAQGGQWQGVPQQSYALHEAAPAASPGGLGRTAFILGLITIGFELISVLVNRSTFGYFGFWAWSGAFIILGLGVAAVLTGLTAIRRPGPHILAGIAVGIGATTVITTVINYAVNVISFFFYF